MKPNTPFAREDSKEKQKRQHYWWLYHIRQALRKKQDSRCADCHKGLKRIRLYRVKKGNDLPEINDYLLLCSPCIAKRREQKERRRQEERNKAREKRSRRQEEQLKTKVWIRAPGKQGVSLTTFFNSIRALVFERDGKACVWCGAKEKLGLGPLTPPSQGGELCFDNYVVTCQMCRGAKGSKLPLEYIWGEISLDYWLHEKLDDGVTVQNVGVTQRLKLHLIGEISQFLMRIAVNEDIEGKIRNKAERLNIKLSETDEDRRRERAEVGSWLG